MSTFSELSACDTLLLSQEVVLVELRLVESGLVHGEQGGGEGVELEPDAVAAVVDVVRRDLGAADLKLKQKNMSMCVFTLGKNAK